jgi:hypothetical protein
MPRECPVQSADIATYIARGWMPPSETRTDEGGASVRIGAAEQQDAADEPWLEWRLAADLGVLRTTRRLGRLAGRGQRLGDPAVETSHD